MSWALPGVPHMVALSPHKPCEQRTVIAPMLEMRKLRLKKVK